MRRATAAVLLCTASTVDGGARPRGHARSRTREALHEGVALSTRFANSRGWLSLPFIVLAFPGVTRSHTVVFVCPYLCRYCLGIHWFQIDCYSGNRKTADCMRKDDGRQKCLKQPEATDGAQTRRAQGGRGAFQLHCCRMCQISGHTVCD